MALKYVAAIIVYSRLIFAASFSSVLVQNGGDVIPLDILSYGAPLTSLDLSQLQLSQLPQLPQLQLPQLPQIVSPCVPPCVIPPPVPVAPAARLVTNVPVVVKKDDPKGYQYAYAVFDPNTGDKKSQSEVGDGSTVQGQYSFVQPDGVRREVSYTANDLKGFNAVVKNIVDSVDSTSADNTDVGQPSPCDDGRSAKITELDSDTTEATTDKTMETTTTDSSANDSPVSNVIISYNDILKCLQSKLQAQNPSPLTYILVPSIKKLC